jgi:hypothetical protein
MHARPAWVLAAIIATGGLSACAVQPVVNVPEAQANSLAFALADRDQRLDSLQTPAVMEYSGANGHFKAREQVIVRRPASLRVEAMSPLGVALVVAADGGQVAVFDPSKNTLARGAATAATLDRFARIPMAPQQAVRLLLGLAPDSAMLAFPPSGWNDQGDMKVLRYARPDGTTDELGFSGRHLVMVRSKLPGGEAGYEVRYSDYRDIGGIEFPYQVEASFPATGTTVKLRYERPIIDGHIDDSLFVLSPGPGTKQLNLSRLSAAAAAKG